MSSFNLEISDLLACVKNFNFPKIPYANRNLNCRITISIQRMLCKCYVTQEIFELKWS